MGVPLSPGTHGITYEPPPPYCSFAIQVSQNGLTLVDQNGIEWSWSAAKGCYVHTYLVPGTGERRTNEWEFFTMPAQQFVQRWWLAGQTSGGTYY